MADHIYVINLDRRKDRWKFMKKQMKKFNLQVERISAIDGNNLEHENEDFDLYVKIARNVRSAVPKKQFKEKIFNQFHIKRSKIPRNTYIYYL